MSFLQVFDPPDQSGYQTVTVGAKEDTSLAFADGEALGLPGTSFTGGDLFGLKVPDLLGLKVVGLDVTGLAEGDTLGAPVGLELGDDVGLVVGLPVTGRRREHVTGFDDAGGLC